jgi:hypothetical protein
MPADIVRFSARHGVRHRASPLASQLSQVIPFPAPVGGLTIADLAALPAFTAQLGDDWFFEIQRDRTGERWALIGRRGRNAGFIVCRGGFKLILIDITGGEDPKVKAS